MSPHPGALPTDMHAHTAEGTALSPTWGGAHGLTGVLMAGEVLGLDLIQKPSGPRENTANEDWRGTAGIPLSALLCPSTQPSLLPSCGSTHQGTVGLPPSLRQRCPALLWVNAALPLSLAETSGAQSKQSPPPVLALGRLRSQAALDLLKEPLGGNTSPPPPGESSPGGGSLNKEQMCSEGVGKGVCLTGVAGGESGPQLPCRRQPRTGKVARWQRSHRKRAVQSSHITWSLHPDPPRCHQDGSQHTCSLTSLGGGG